jgi:hypothetical protein
MLALPSTSVEIGSYIIRVILFGVLISLTVRWVIATDYEFKLWTRMLENPVEKWDGYAAIVALSFILGFCLAFAFDIVKVSLAFTGYLLINYWSQWLSNEHFATALRATRKNTGDTSKKKVLDAMEQFWLKQPQLARITTMMFFSSLAFSFAWAGSFEIEPQRHWFQQAATALLIVTIVLGEIIIGVWRYKRNKDMVVIRSVSVRWDIGSTKEDGATLADQGDLKGLRTNAYVLIFGVAFGLNVVNNFKSWVPAIPFVWDIKTWLFATSLIFLLQLLVLSYSWIWATKKELNLWIKWLKNPIDKDEATLAIITLAIVLGILLAYAYMILFISFAITLYFLLNYWTQWLANDHFERALKRSRDASLNATKRKVLNIMEEYWLIRPQLARITTLMFFASMAFSLALAGWVQQMPRRAFFYLASYTVLFLNLLFGEVAIFRWRRDRDKKIKQATQQESN